MNRDIGHNINVTLKNSTSVSVLTNLASSDLLGADAFALCANPSAVGGAGGTLTLEHSDNDSVFVAVPAAEVITDNNVLAVGVAIQIGYRGSKRYVRGVITPATSATANVVAVGAMFGRQPQVPPIA